MAPSLQVLFSSTYTSLNINLRMPPAPSHISVSTFACPFVASDAARAADYTLLSPTIKVTPAGDTLLRMLQLQDWLEVHAKDNEAPGSDVGVAKALQQYHQHHIELPCPDGGGHTLSENDDSDTYGGILD
jgi:NAD+ kinase